MSPWMLQGWFMAPWVLWGRAFAHWRKTYSRKYLTNSNPTGIVRWHGKKGERESKGHSERGKERGTAANAFCRTWLLNVPVIGAIWEVGSFHFTFPHLSSSLPPPPLFLFFFPSPLSPLPHPLTYRKHVGKFFLVLCLLHLANPSQRGTTGWE